MVAENESSAMEERRATKRFTIAAEGPMELSGRMVQVRDGKVVPVSDEVM